jgi:hypothetical protein
MHSTLIRPPQLNVQLNPQQNMLFFVDLSNLLLYCTQFSFAPSRWFGSFTSLRFLIAYLYKKVSLPSFWYRALFLSHYLLQLPCGPRVPARNTPNFFQPLFLYLDQAQPQTFLSLDS